MLKLTILLTFIGIGNISFAQDLVNFRLTNTPESGQFKNRLQGSYNISPKTETLGLELGIELQFRRSKPSIFSCDCNPNIGENDIIHPSDVLSFSRKTYDKSTTAGIFSRFLWNSDQSGKLRITPMVELHLLSEILNHYYIDQLWNYQDGTSYDQPKIKVVDHENIQLGFFAIPILQMDYLIIPKWKIRLGVSARFNVDLLGKDNIRDNTIILGAILSKSLLPLKN